MMINTNYAEQIVLGKKSKASVVNFDHNTKPINAISAEKDTLTLSDRALAMLNGKEYKIDAPTFRNPQTANSVLAQYAASSGAKEIASEDKQRLDERFNNIMQNILDKRLGVDREKLEELEAMMKEIAENENMSPEEKQEALEKLTKMREKVIQEAQELQDMAKQTES